MRGEDGVEPAVTSSPGGSPPHARGRLKRPAMRTGSTRITPACAGKTLSGPGPSGRVRDHPRMRGEDPPLRRRPRQVKGSPPHARGRPCRYIRASSGRRITPACAGKTPRPLPARLPSPDHPRMRGEDDPQGEARDYLVGSPPHARGRLRRGRCNARATRITPACAGKTELLHTLVC